MKICIICREPKEHFNDEHVIPDAIGGYYHIYSVCTDCNSKLGGSIDHMLTNHKFIEFQRHLLSIKGKNGSVPNPLRGTHTIKDDTQKVVLEIDSEGMFKPVLLPQVPKPEGETLTGDFTILVDKKDEADLDTIVNKFLDRNGIDRSLVTSKKSYHESKPTIHIKFVIDLHNFKAALLKIAYEFGVDSIPEYFNDDQAKIISKILHDTNFAELTEKVNFLGSGFDKEVLKPLEHLIEFKGDHHYLVLVSGDFGLMCLINLFNALSIGIILSTKKDYLVENMIVGKNDITSHTFRKYNINEIMDVTHAQNEFGFGLWFPTQQAADSYQLMEKHPKFEFESNGGLIPFYDALGNVKYQNIEEKLLQQNLPKAPKGDPTKSLITEFGIHEDLYIRILPSKQLYKVEKVRMIRKRIGKL